MSFLILKTQNHMGLRKKWTVQQIKALAALGGFASPHLTILSLDVAPSRTPSIYSHLYPSFFSSDSLSFLILSNNCIAAKNSFYSVGENGASGASLCGDSDVFGMEPLRLCWWWLDGRSCNLLWRWWCFWHDGYVTLEPNVLYHKISRIGLFEFNIYFTVLIFRYITYSK